MKIKNNQNTKLLTMKEAADYLGICYRTMQRLVYERKVAFIKIYGAYRFTTEDLEVFIESNRIDRVVSLRSKLREIK
ncbi:MAG: helix-turn-helix domain-containing protein [bacterium]